MCILDDHLAIFPFVIAVNTTQHLSRCKGSSRDFLVLAVLVPYPSLSMIKAMGRVTK